MNTVGIVAISLLAGMFLLAMVAGLVLLIVLAMRLSRALDKSQKENAAVYAETRTALSGYQAEIKAAIDSAKASFSAIRTETKTILEEHRKQMQGGIEKINAEALQGAAARSIQACMRLEKVAVTMQSLFLDAETRPTHEYGAEDFAPEATTFGGPPSAFSVGQTSAMDAEAEAAAVQAAPSELFQE